MDGARELMMDPFRGWAERRRVGEENSGWGSLERGGLLPGGYCEAMTKDSFRVVVNGELSEFVCATGVLQEHELVLGLFGFVEDGFKFFPSVATGFGMSECGGNDPAQMFFAALKV